MKKIILSFISFIALSIGIAQAQAVVLVPPVPAYGCPGKTHDVTVGVKNNSGFDVPGGYDYTINVTFYDNNTSTALAPTNSQTFNDAIPDQTTKTITIPAIPFGVATTCSVAVSLNYTFPSPGSFSTSGTYTVQTPPTLTIQESPAGTVSLTTTLDAAYSTLFYLNADYGTIVNTSTTGSYTPTAVGSYTAKAFEANSAGGCISSSASNAVSITATPIIEGQNVNISVYPNPITSSVTISTTLSDRLSYELSDMNGTLLRSADFTSAANLNVENLKSGSYVLTIKSNDSKIGYYKLIK